MEPNYEFTEKQNDLFRLLQMRMRFVGIVFILVGLAISFFLILVKAELISFPTRYTIVGVLFAVFLIITGIMFWRAANAFLKIIKTQGNDIEILMDAVKDLHYAFDIQMYMIIVSVFFVIITAIFLR